MFNQVFCTIGVKYISCLDIVKCLFKSRHLL